MFLKVLILLAIAMSFIKGTTESEVEQNNISSLINLLQEVYDVTELFKSCGFNNLVS